METKIDFPLNWGLGSSSTLIYNVAQWAYISPFELLFSTMGGSGYDIACAQSNGPILYRKNTSGPHWSPTEFNPPFKDKLYFVYLGQKQDSREGISYYEKNKGSVTEVVHKLSQISGNIISCEDFNEFELLISGHEKVVSNALGIPMVKEERFSDYWGQIKSLGAWGGDFVLVTSSRSKEETIKYFERKGHDVFVSYDELILGSELKSEKSEKVSETLQ